MAASTAVEEERGTYTRTPHRHNGYYAGDFSRYADARPTTTFQPLDGPHS